MVQEANLFWHTYKYFPYEKELALKEINNLLEPFSIEDKGSFINIKGNFNKSLFERLVYFSKVETNKYSIPTTQQRLEQSVFSSNQIINKQSTRYSVHGLHEYKGKFNPQIVKSLMNLFVISKKNRIIDPFCGSGTTLVESALLGAKSIGFDINPLAIYITNAKLEALNIPIENIKKSADLLFAEFAKSISKYKIENDNPRINYLRKWFPEETLLEIENLKDIIRRNKLSNIFYVLVSNILREYSLQEPADLRIRRRKSPFPNVSLIDALKVNINNVITKLENSQNITGLINSNSKSIICDIRKDLSLPATYKNSYDFALTSPPYATALPYIDTQRLSLVWLDLLAPDKINELEAQLIGSREFYNGNKNIWISYLKSNRCCLPVSIYNFCIELENKISPDDGFRRRVVPSLLYRYFSEMKVSFQNMHHMLKNNSYYLLIVGNNKTTLGGEEILVQTPILLSKIAEQCNWRIIDLIKLQTYQRYDVHKTNSIKDETLIILQKII